MLEYSAIAGQRNLYVEQQVKLLSLSQSTQRERCEQVPIDENGDVFLVQFSLEGTPFPDGIRHHIWCQRDKLFQKSPVRNLHEGLLAQFIAESGLMIFREQLSGPPKNSVRKQPPSLYWFNADETEWTLDKNVNAVIVAEGDLHIRGKGKISGSVITKGKLTLDEDIKVTYSKSTVAHIVQQYSRWRLAENSWYDFAVTEN
ncbi:DUF2572 family protein [Aggregatibacter actinomycetemcomitans]|uniref:DUF2572 family protein n=1 Tax=Aggregatibacter actinomycetemcomitans TaxID=714 RepID=UPI00022C025D|nr:DUF2572 family protein [Aggregatibacter actinomycetemcomitans]AEW78106.1 hypothetical protein ANH9381_2226 [Aggregatibacter actinomycetemcomitans ANH9381]UXM96963.1 DUF2572 family protein [Aggregatibacter actinomycetemcomitans]